jgi:hypothetical protein
MAGYGGFKEMRHENKLIFLEAGILAADDRALHPKITVAQPTARLFGTSDLA